MSLLKVDNLVVVRSRKAAPVLNRVSFSLERGEKVALLGPSGAGKTTLFRAINGFVPMAAGSISVEGVSVAGLRGYGLRRLRSRIAVVSQRHDLVDRLKVYQNVMAGALGRWPALRALRFLFWPKAAELEEAAQALDRVGLAKKLRERTAEISTGERQRVAIARALVQQPALLLAHEPIASLDPALSHQIISLMCRLATENGFALLCSLHQPEFAAQYFDRVIRIHHGTLEADSPRPQLQPAVGLPGN